MEENRDTLVQLSKRQWINEFIVHVNLILAAMGWPRVSWWVAGARVQALMSYDCTTTTVPMNKVQFISRRPRGRAIRTIWTHASAVSRAPGSGSGVIFEYGSGNGTMQQHVQ
ncbi:hypothetical protein ZHAS_00020521 [Anopheles sinensis]|uniref:Uncharacterized protein n=1 Tax=Anopheles sinensis TaxID=74873 RepID=A0A084WQ28_ANOSI|nr:hypothetical protein ZHAS_00020521 [Anopheles sinensis]